MRQLISITLAFVSLLSSADGWLWQGCPPAEMAMMEKARCACCAQRLACDCDPTSDQAPKPVPVPASTRHEVPVCPCVPLASTDLAPLKLVAADRSMPTAFEQASHLGRQVPMFILHCAALC